MDANNPRLTRCLGCSTPFLADPTRPTIASTLPRTPSQRRLALLEHLRPFSAVLADFLLSARFDGAKRQPLEFVLEVGRSCLPQRRSSGQVGIAPSEIIDQIRERPEVNSRCPVALCRVILSAFCRFKSVRSRILLGASRVLSVTRGARNDDESFTLDLMALERPTAQLS